MCYSQMEAVLLSESTEDLDLEYLIPISNCAASLHDTLDNKRHPYVLWLLCVYKRITELIFFYPERGKCYRKRLKHTQIRTIRELCCIFS